LLRRHRRWLRCRRWRWLRCRRWRGCRRRRRRRRWRGLRRRHRCRRITLIISRACAATSIRAAHSTVGFRWIAQAKYVYAAGQHTVKYEASAHIARIMTDIVVTARRHKVGNIPVVEDGVIECRCNERHARCRIVGHLTVTAGTIKWCKPSVSTSALRQTRCQRNRR
jgi:hypothetical protein